MVPVNSYYIVIYSYIHEGMHTLSSLDLIGVVAWIANLLLFVIPDLIRDPLLWGRNVEESSG